MSLCFELKLSQYYSLIFSSLYIYTSKSFCQENTDQTLGNNPGPYLKKVRSGLFFEDLFLLFLRSNVDLAFLLKGWIRIHGFVVQVTSAGKRAKVVLIQTFVDSLRPTQGRHISRSALFLIVKMRMYFSWYLLQMVAQITFELHG